MSNGSSFGQQDQYNSLASKSSLALSGQGGKDIDPMRVSNNPMSQLSYQGLVSHGNPAIDQGMNQLAGMAGHDYQDSRNRAFGAYALAANQANGGMTPQQQMLANSQQAANGMLGAQAASAGGGARGAAAAGDTAQQSIGMNAPMQQAQMQQQRAMDMSQGANLQQQMAAGIAKGDYANAMANQQNQYRQLGINQQAQGINDQSMMGFLNLNSADKYAQQNTDLGYNQMAANQQQQNNQLTNQYLSAGISAADTLMAGAGSQKQQGGGGGNGGNP